MSCKADILDATSPMRISSCAGQSCSWLTLTTILGLRHFTHRETVALRNYFTCLGPASELARHTKNSLYCHGETHSVHQGRNNWTANLFEVSVPHSSEKCLSGKFCHIRAIFPSYFPVLGPWDTTVEGQARSQPLLSSHHITSHLNNLWSKSGQG